MNDSRANQSMLVLSVLKALDVIDCLAAEKNPLSAREIAFKCKYSRPTVYRLLVTLASKGFVVSPIDGLFELSPKFLSLSKNLLEKYDLVKIAKPSMESLSQLSGETVHLAIMDDIEILYIGKVDSSQSIRMYSSIGTRNPIYSTAMGKAILAFMSKPEQLELIKQIHFVARTANTITNPSLLIASLDEIHSLGYAFDDIENEEGVRCVAAPIFDFTSKVIGAISISGPAYRLDIERLTGLSTNVRNSAMEISRLSGYRKEID